nr:hypothetical protein Iba_chr07cCG2130 [Ipomoea batatas]
MAEHVSGERRKLTFARNVCSAISVASAMSKQTLESNNKVAQLPTQKGVMDTMKVGSTQRKKLWTQKRQRPIIRLHETAVSHQLHDNLLQQPERAGHDDAPMHGRRARAHAEPPAPPLPQPYRASFPPPHHPPPRPAPPRHHGGVGQERHRHTRSLQHRKLNLIAVVNEMD